MIIFHFILMSTRTGASSAVVSYSLSILHLIEASMTMVSNACLFRAHLSVES